MVQAEVIVEVTVILILKESLVLIHKKKNFIKNKIKN